MDISLPLPHAKSEGLEDGYRQHHEGTTDDADTDGFFMTLIHTVCKNNTILQNHQTIRQFSDTSSQINVHLSQIHAEYPKYLEG